eukprot:3809986-Pyramimonas_sp.AAC.1
MAPQQDGSRVLQSILHEVFTTNAMTSQGYRTEAHKFDGGLGEWGPWAPGEESPFPLSVALGPQWPAATSAPYPG